MNDAKKRSTNFIKINKQTKKRILIGAIIIATILLDVYVTGFMKFGYNVARCGGMPVAVYSPAFGIAPQTYLVPGKYTPGGAKTQYFCSESGAKQAGYNRSVLQGY